MRNTLVNIVKPANTHIKRNLALNKKQRDSCRRNQIKQWILHKLRWGKI